MAMEGVLQLFNSLEIGVSSLSTGATRLNNLFEQLHCVLCRGGE